jgi:hypothetical protein
MVIVFLDSSLLEFVECFDVGQLYKVPATELLRPNPKTKNSDNAIGQSSLPGLSSTTDNLSHHWVRPRQVRCFQLIAARTMVGYFHASFRDFLRAAALSRG